ncbi:amidase [Burkholderiaceae bacterium UC74_6]
MQRRTLLLASGATAVLPLSAQAAARSLTEKTALELAADMAAGRLSAASLVDACLKRIEAIDRKGARINSVIELNPEARTLARQLDAERRAGHLRGPLHGLPVLLKDNIATGDRMQTTAGSLALAGLHAARDAQLVTRLRAAGAVILGKTNLSEWANIRSTRSTSGWSGRGGLTRNPYALDRNTSGSSSGSAAAVAAELVPFAVGSETDGSIVSPSSICGLVGLKPTVGRVSGDGIIPISHTQDTAGPMARTVADCALLYAALCEKPDGAPVLDANALKGKRLGVARSYFTGYDEADAVIGTAMQRLRDLGATVIDPVDLPAPAYGDAELNVLLFELKTDLAQWLKTYAPGHPIQTLADVIAFNKAHAKQEMPWFGQELFERADKLGGLDSPEYLDALKQCREGSRTNGIDKVMDTHQLDALIAPTGSLAWLTDPINADHYGASFSTPAAVAGYPHLTVPAGLVRGLPIGLSFVGRANSENALLAMGYAYEQGSRARQRPRYLANTRLL